MPVIAKGEDILLPRGYLSYSQWKLRKKNPGKYNDIYFFGGKSFTNAGMRFGKIVAEALETGETQDPTIKALMSILPRYPRPEHEIKTRVNTNEGVLTLLGKLDTFFMRGKTFREYKTGKTKWTQAKVDKDEQITWYYALVYLEYGHLPEKKAWLDWIETEYEKGEKPKLTGRIESFETDRTMGDVLELLADIHKVALDISGEYKAMLGI